ncbi:MAG: glutamine--tRNA ligase/YqeY domain fusion protein [bacterium]|nr:glutamine--tRNA ligase/YqeY domain fusion protein [bacterium]
MSQDNPSAPEGGIAADAEKDASPHQTNFIRNIIEEDLRTGKHKSIVTRFPPEPNGYLHIGHAKAVCLDFGLAKEYGGRCHLRFDDTNPAKEDEEYIRTIQEDVRWLGFDWGEHMYYASDYFEKLYMFAEDLIKRGKAYVDDSSAEEIRASRGTLTEPGKNSPYRDRTVEENLDLFRRMKAGEFPDGSRVLRAKIDMAHPNIVMRDPTIYRIRRMTHPHVGDKWCIYPIYDFTHCLSDSIEGITHSLCTLEFENNRPLYDWVLEQLECPCRPRQIEFSRLNLESTITSKRKMLQLVRDHHVAGWDDPRMPTIAGMRRRGYTPESIRLFAERIGISKAESWISYSVFEQAVRDDLNTKVPRVIGVLRPLRVVIDNYPDDLVEEMEAPFFPDDPPKMGSRMLPFSKVVYIDQDDFMENPPSKFFRLAPGREVRLRRAYIIKCESVVKDESGKIIELHCTYDPESKGGNPADGRKIKGTIHWVSEAHSLPAEVRLYDRLFAVEHPACTEGVDYITELNPNSLEVIENARVERSLAGTEPGKRFQFERTGYFITDPDTTPDHLVFNRIVTLKDSWAKIQKK